MNTSLLILCGIGGLAALGFIYETAGSYYDRRRYPPLGRLFDIGFCRLHLNRQGSGEPVVILEAGIAGSSLGWAVVQEKLAAFTTVCSYDRAGLGWSDACALPRSATQLAAELHALLDRAGVAGPYILVGHSFGGLLIRAYGHLYPEQVAGLLLLDPVSLETWAASPSLERRRLEMGVRLARRGAVLARFGIVRAALTALVSGARHLPQLVAKATAQRASSTIERLVGEVRKLPEEVWPIIRSHWSRPQSFLALARYLQSLPSNAEAALAMRLPANTPCVILSAATATPAELRERDSWRDQTQAGRHIQAVNAGHWLQLDQPDLVLAAVRELVEQARKQPSA
ncbi:MAG: alpha/beta hydrolase [Bryobacteraceae bacterium]